MTGPLWLEFISDMEQHDAHVWDTPADVDFNQYLKHIMWQDSLHFCKPPIDLPF